tara:strand:+ start:584 stop:742 length:159 start_codon:yes stop_codon:yes gene_type:complete
LLPRPQEEFARKRYFGFPRLGFGDLRKGLKEAKSTPRVLVGVKREPEGGTKL